MHGSAPWKTEETIVNLPRLLVLSVLSRSDSPDSPNLVAGTFAFLPPFSSLPDAMSPFTIQDIPALSVLVAVTFPGSLRSGWWLHLPGFFHRLLDQFVVWIEDAGFGRLGLAVARPLAGTQKPQITNGQLLIE